MKIQSRFFIIFLIVVASMMLCIMGKLNAESKTKDIDCSNPQDMASMGICQAKETEKAYKEMKTVYEKVANTMEGGRKELFENYQKAWEQYIVTKCFFDNSESGSSFGLNSGSCEEKYYKERIKELKRIRRENKQ